MALIFIRTTIIFVTLLFIMRLMGKSQIGEMQPFEFVITLVIAELACIPMADSSIPLLYGIVAIVAIFILHQIVWLLDLWFKPIKSLVCGKPSVVINKNGLDEKSLKENNLDVGDVVENMRTAGYFSLDDVDYALFEASGSFSVLEKAQTRENKSMSVIVIDRGKLDKKNLEKCKIAKSDVYALLKENCAPIRSVIALTVDGNGRVYFQKRGEKYKILSLKTGVKW